MRKLLTLLFVTLAILSPLRANPLLTEAIGLEANLRDLIEIVELPGEPGDPEVRKRNLSTVRILSLRQEELALQIARNWFKEHGAEEMPATGMLIDFEKSIKEMEELLLMTKEKNLPAEELELARVALQDSINLWKKRATEEGTFLIAVAFCQKYFPKFDQENTDFGKRIQRKIDEAIERDDPVLKNPKHLILFCDQVANEIAFGKIRLKVPVQE